ncbi:MAG: HD-GYP domain-containing protein [Proteobacteria bacterium]|nr:HD-GYP domain-containing protein [Pseudomonadota bacterium]MBU1536854.1 HD-GYP domain-containing protein [Myxococcota bacterium]
MERISIDALQVGMYVLEVGEGSFDNPSTKINMSMMFEQEILAFRQAGIKTVLIDPERSHVPHAKETAPVTTDFRKSLQEVDQKLAKAVAYSRSMMTDVRMGKSVNPEEATPVVNEILDSIFRNESAALFLTKLGNYDDYTYMHCVNVSVLASVFGKHLGLKDKDLFNLGLSGLLHDIGKSLIPDEILNKPSKLTKEEMETMQAHPLKGYKLLKDTSGLHPNVLLGMLQHHEKWTGAGYPLKISGEKINTFARILAVVDVYDAMTSNRVYHTKRAETDVLGFLFSHKADFAPGYVERFVKAVGIYPAGTLVRLSDDRLAVVCNANPEDSLKPYLSVISDRMKVSPACTQFDTLAEGNPELKIIEVLDQQEHNVDITSLKH